jgi:GDP-L-fucose synthase
MNKDSKIYVPGHAGMVGSALVRELHCQGYKNIVTKLRADLDLTRQNDVNDFFAKEKPDYVFLAAAKVGGIEANRSFPVDFIRDNLLIQSHVIEAAYYNGVKKLLFLGSSCIYPKLSPQPIKEEFLLTGSLEPTNEWYAIAKIAGLKLCQAYRRQFGFNAIALMPTNLYGPNDNFSLTNSHVLPALIRKMHEAKIYNAEVVEIWGTGKPRREFLYVYDLANACVYLMNNYDGEDIINVGCGQDVTIIELAKMIKEIVGFKGSLIFNPRKPDGTSQKLLDVSNIHTLGWCASTTIECGIKKTYQWYVDNELTIRK